MKSKLILILCAGLVAGAFTSCSMMGQKANCFGPITPAQVQAHNDFTAKLSLP